MGTEQRFRPEGPDPSDAASPDAPPAPARPRRPSPGGKLRLPRRRPLREGICFALSRILAAARRVARSAGQDRIAAVHEYRKSLRRARAVVALLAPSLGKAATRGLARRLQAAFHATTVLRDADVLLTTLRRVPTAAEDDLARHAIEVVLELDQGRTLRETSQALGEGLRAIAALPAALDVVLPAEYSARDLERGLARSRRRERRALERARQTRSDEDLHGWRKRVKELRYQIELVASTGSSELRKREKALAELSQRLGEVTDLIVLARDIRRREKEGSIPPAPALLEQIRELASEDARDLLERGSGLFEEEARLFARKVIGERG